MPCGLVNFPGAEVCARCGGEGVAGADEEMTATTGASFFDEEAERKPPSLRKRALVILGSVCFVLLVFYVSLLQTSQAASYDEKQAVARAVLLIERQGFAREAFILRHLANYRTSDNWWNRWLGHGDAYAATNFPFQVVTLYPDFFTTPADDTERAAILLHEARHLSGEGEEKAFARVWRDKAKLGWTKEKYGATRVWKNVAEFTSRYAPKVFQCGVKADADCTE